MGFAQEKPDNHTLSCERNILHSCLISGSADCLAFNLYISFPKGFEIHISPTPPLSRASPKVHFVYHKPRQSDHDPRRMHLTTIQLSQTKQCSGVDIVYGSALLNYSLFLRLTIRGFVFQSQILTSRDLCILISHFFSASRRAVRTTNSASTLMVTQEDKSANDVSSVSYLNHNVWIGANHNLAGRCRLLPFSLNHINFCRTHHYQIHVSR